MPEKMKFLFENASGYISGLIVFFILRSKIKNNFTIGPLVTDQNGEIILTKHLVEDTITLSKTEYPMDYGGDLCNCDLLAILVENKNQLEERIARLNEFYPENASALREILNDATNDKISVFKEIKMPVKNKEFHIKVSMEHRGTAER